MLKDPQYPEARPFGSAGIRKPPSDKEPRPSLLLGIRRMQKPRGKAGRRGKREGSLLPRAAPCSTVAVAVSHPCFPNVCCPALPTPDDANDANASPERKAKSGARASAKAAAAGRRSGDSGAGRDQRTAVHNRKQSPRREKAQDAKGRTRKKVFFNRSQFLREYEKRDFGLVCGSIRE